jgi:Tfp pilus assembly protein PilP
MSTSERSRRPTVAVMAILASALLAGVPAAPVRADSWGPFVALDKAKDTSANEGARAHAEDATAATLGAKIEPAPAAAAAAVPAADQASTGAAAPAAATAPAGTVPAAGDVKNDAANAAPGAAPSDAAAHAPVETASYDAGQHRDPFRPPGIANQVVDNSPRTPLEGYDLGQLKLVGVVTEIAGGARAMVEDSSGLGYIVTTGTPIGTSGGVVTRIEPRRVLIEEHVTNFYGEKEPKQIVMELPKEDRSP